ncbi:tetratricopeptide repeat protein [Actinocorallia longicatena]|uniref:Tetratricopeptide repeat protein n=1 Tax=Actinocorallia longicatena TaxID=111803 RepID=A0ABP6QJN9_9ACTN
MMIRNPGEGSFWRALGDAERRNLLAIGHVTAVPARGTLCHQGTPARDVLILVDGFAKEMMDAHDGTEAIIGLLGPGDLEGDQAIWGHPQRATLTALTELTVLRVDSRKLATMVAADPRITDALMRVTATRWTHAGRRHAVRAGTPSQRLAFHLQELAARFGQGGRHGIRVPMPFTHAELANWIGISRESLGRSFARWRGGLIDTSPARAILVLDAAGLREEAGPWGEEWSVPEAPPPGVAVRLAVRPPVTLVRSAARLPARPEYFTGRRAELTRLSLLQADRRRVIVVQGMAGVGKTALAVHWAHLVADSFPDGRIFVDLRGPGKAATPVEALGQILRGLGVPGDQVPTDENELVALYRSLMSGGRILLVLDNASGEYEQIRPLIPLETAGLVLVTTKQRLRGLDSREGDLTTFELGEMQPDEAVDLVAAVVGDGRVETERAAAEELARECAYLPLALRIAAAKLAGAREDSIAGTVRQLSGRDRLSAFALPDDPHGALRAAFEVSYTGLSPDLRAAFRRLGLTVGPDFAPPSVAALFGCDEEAALAALEELKRAFLVVEPVPGRYRLHDLLKDFSRDLGSLEDAESDRQNVQRRLLSHYLNQARAARDALGGQGRQEAIAWFEAERRCLVSAVRRSAGLGLHRTAYALADALYDFMEFRRYSEDNIAVHRLGLSSAQAASDWGAAAVMLHHLAVAHLELGRCVRAIGYGEDARRGYRALGDRSGEAAVLDALAAVYAMLGRQPVAIEHAEMALVIHRDLGEAGGEARALDILAQSHLRLGRYDEAFAYAMHALELRQVLGDRRGEAETLLNLARVHRHRGNFQRAMVFALEALEVRQQLEHRHGEADARSELARIHQQLGNAELARRDANLALAIYRSVGARDGEGETLVILARVRISEARYTEAVTHCADALRVLRAIQHRSAEAEAAALFGASYYWLGRYPEARENLRRSIEIRRQVGDLAGEAHDLDYLGKLERRLGRTSEAVLLGLEALALFQELGAREGEAGTLGSLARTYLRLGLGEEAEQAIETSLEIRRAIDDRLGLGTGLDTLALILRRTGRPDEAAEISREALKIMDEVGDLQGIATANVNLGDTCLLLDRLSDARRCAETALTIATDLGDRRNLSSANHTLGLVCQRQDRHDQAIAHFETEIELRAEMGDHRGQIHALEAVIDSRLLQGDRSRAEETRRRVAGIQRWLGHH